MSETRSYVVGWNDCQHGLADLKARNVYPMEYCQEVKSVPSKGDDYTRGAKDCIDTFLKEMEVPERKTWTDNNEPWNSIR